MGLSITKPTLSLIVIRLIGFEEEGSKQKEQDTPGKNCLPGLTQVSRFAEKTRKTL